MSREAAGRDRPIADELLANAASLYYKEGLTQSEVAKRMGVSRATVISYLRLARERNVVTIRIGGDAFASSTLSRELRSAFQLTDAYVADHSPTAARSRAHSAKAMRLEESAFNHHVARVGAEALHDVVTARDVLGVAWGETIEALGDALAPADLHGLEVCQVVGSMKSPLLAAAETCTIRIATSLGAECNTLHAPAILSSVELATALRAEPIIASQLKRLSRLTRTLFSVGHCGPSTHVAQAKVLTGEAVARYRRKGAVGILCGRFIDAAGEHIEGEIDARMIGISLTQLRRLRSGVLVAGGPLKLEAIRATLAGGYVSHLVTDDDTARRLLAEA